MPAVLNELELALFNRSTDDGVSTLVDDEVPETLTYYSLLLVYLTTHELHTSESNDVVPLRLVLVQVL